MPSGRGNITSLPDGCLKSTGRRSSLGCMQEDATQRRSFTTSDWWVPQPIPGSVPATGQRRRRTRQTPNVRNIRDASSQPRHHVSPSQESNHRPLRGTFGPANVRNRLVLPVHAEPECVLVEVGSLHLDRGKQSHSWIGGPVD